MTYSHNNKKNEPTIPYNLLQTLRDCATSTRLGFVDKGNPKKLFQLSSLKLVEAKDGGYVVTSLGREYLSVHKRDLMKL